MNTPYATRRSHQVIAAGSDLEAELADLLAYALAGTDVVAPYGQLVPGTIERRETLPGYFARLLASAREGGWLACTFEDQAGMALWARYPPCDGQGRKPARPVAPAAPETIARFELVRDQERARLMGDRPHAHLHTLCPRFRIKDHPVERALLEERLAQLDFERVAAYADPARAEHRALLLKYEFRPLPAREGMPLIYPMVREPHGP